MDEVLEWNPRGWRARDLEMDGDARCGGAALGSPAGVWKAAVIERERLRAQLLLHEGLRRFPYVDTVGKLTIGVGRNITDVGISETEAMYLLVNDIDACIRDLATFTWFPELDPIRQRVLVDMRFNLGPSRFRGFKNTLVAVARGDFDSDRASLSAR